MNGYIALWRGKRVEVRAESSYAAQVEAARVLGVRPTKRHEVSVTLAESADGKPVVHLPLM
jgi:hypothetical protein